MMHWFLWFWFGFGMIQSEAPLEKPMFLVDLFYTILDVITLLLGRGGLTRSFCSLFDTSGQIEYRHPTIGTRPTGGAAGAAGDAPRPSGYRPGSNVHGLDSFRPRSCGGCCGGSCGMR